ncbi:NADPH:quinone oxidoreductase family protein [Sphingobium sp.]|uniref:NADPH:quinone oxidoreductase family protein n=1 Tax=Sphingobium sp. TaxID=1912891 RepID=UPI0028BEA1DC|nr:NADPH:quinone oxidoreductase family protein [Sphingobium sp.]
MKAWISTAAGGPETLTFGDLPDRIPQRGEVLVSVKACGLNYPDLLMMRDGYQFRMPRPFAPGSEVSGVVAAIGEGVADFAVGDRVFGLCTTGGLAEQAILRARDAFHLPARISFEDGAGFLFTYGTSHYALTRRGNLARGEKVLVLGAGGGIGLSAVEIASALGAVVTAAASDETKLDLARSRGAASAMAYPRELEPDAAKGLGQAFRQAAGDGGFDVVVDPVGGAYCEPALRATGWHGRYLVIGFAAGIPKVPLNLPLLKGSSIVGVDWYNFGMRDPAARARDVEALVAMIVDGRIKPSPSTVVGFAEALDALVMLDARAIAGKVVVTLEHFPPG